MTAFLADHAAVFLGIALGLFYIGAIAMARDAVMRNRTAQGAIAWAVSLVTFPIAALPLYPIFGRSRFHGYVAARRSDNRDLKPIVDRLAAGGPVYQASMAAGTERGRARARGAVGGFVEPIDQVTNPLFPVPHISEFPNSRTP